MKTFALSLLLCLTFSAVLPAQDVSTGVEQTQSTKKKKAKKKKVQPPWYKQKITKKNVKEKESDALRAAEYLLSNPAKPLTEERADRMDFLNAWMEKTPDHDFGVGKFYGNTVRNSPELDELYRAAVVKILLTVPGSTSESEATDLAIGRILTDYCKVKSNKVYGSSNIKKMIRADKKGELDEMILSLRE